MNRWTTAFLLNTTLCRLEKLFALSDFKIAVALNSAIAEVKWSVESVYRIVEDKLSRMTQGFFIQKTTSYTECQYKEGFKYDEEGIIPHTCF